MHYITELLTTKQLNKFFVRLNISFIFFRNNKMVNPLKIQIEDKDQAFFHTYLDDQPFHTEQKYYEGK